MSKKAKNPLTPLAAGCIAGGIEATAVWPMEYIKVGPRSKKWTAFLDQPLIIFSLFCPYHFSFCHMMMTNSHHRVVIDWIHIHDIRNIPTSPNPFPILSQNMIDPAAIAIQGQRSPITLYRHDIRIVLHGSNDWVSLLVSWFGSYSDWKCSQGRNTIWIEFRHQGSVARQEWKFDPGQEFLGRIGSRGSRGVSTSIYDHHQFLLLSSVVSVVWQCFSISWRETKQILVLVFFARHIRIAIVAPVETVKTKVIELNMPFIEGFKHIVRTDGIKGVYQGVSVDCFGWKSGVCMMAKLVCCFGNY